MSINMGTSTPHTGLVSDVLISVRIALATDTLTPCRWMLTKGEPDMTHDTRVADWLGRSGASVKTDRFQCVIHFLSLEAAVIHH